MKNRTVEIVTNLAFLVAAHRVLLVDTALLPVAIFIAITGILSGIHHRMYTRTTRGFDYVGMYFALISIFLFYVGVYGWINMLITMALGGAIMLALGSNRIAVGILMAPPMIAVYLYCGPGAFLWVAGLAYMAYLLNFIGDKIHPKYHSLIHGGWHVLIALTYSEGAVMLASELFT